MTWQAARQVFAFFRCSQSMILVFLTQDMSQHFHAEHAT